MNIASIMKRTVLTIGPDASIEEANRQMRDHDIRHLPVTVGANLVGIVSDRDISLATTFTSKVDQQLRNVRLEEPLSVADVMTANPVILRPTDGLVAAIRTMRDGKLGAFPVMDRDALVGIVTTTDLLEACLEQLVSAGAESS